MSQQLEFTEAELKAFRSEYAKGATDSQFELFISEAKARNLRPGPHLVFQLRNAKEYDQDTKAWQYVKKPYWITTISALRLIAQRTGQYAGQSPAEFIYLDDQGFPSIISQIPLPDKDNKPLPREPWAVRVAIKRKDFDEPIIGMTRFEAVANFREKEVNGHKVLALNEIWAKRGPEMTQKCAEADGFRRAFAEEAGHLYLLEELKNEVEEILPEKVTPASVVPQPPSVPKVNQTPAVPTEAPRPNEKMPVETAKAVLEVLPKLEEFVSNPAVQEQLAAEGKKVDYEEIERLKAAAKAAVPDLKPASELPPPEKKKRGPKPKNPENGQPEKPVDGGITQADIDNASKPESKVDEAALKQEATEFVDSITNFTAEEAAEQGLPEPPEYSLIPTKGSEQLKGFGNRVRALVSAGVSNPAIKNYLLDLGKKKSTDLLTVGDWTNALNTLEGLPIEQAKEVTRNAPLPEF
jgi:hypothetical protein